MSPLPALLALLSPSLASFPPSFHPSSSLWPCQSLQFQFRAISSPFTPLASLTVSTLSLLLSPPSGRSLFNIDFLSKGRKYRESIELRVAALANVKPRRLFSALRGSTKGDESHANVRGMFPGVDRIVCIMRTMIWERKRNLSRWNTFILTVKIQKYLWDRVDVSNF